MLAGMLHSNNYVVLALGLLSCKRSWVQIPVQPYFLDFYSLGLTDFCT